MDINILVQNIGLSGVVEIPDGARSMVIFSFEGGDKSEIEIRKHVADELLGAGIATLMIDLSGEKKNGTFSKRNGFDLLTERLIAITKWSMANEVTKKFSVSYFGLGDGVAPALSASAYWGTNIGAVVCFGGKPNIAMESLDLIESPTLLIVSDNDKEVVGYVKQAYQKMGCVKKMEVIQENSYLDEDSEVARKVAVVAGNWYRKHMLS